MSSVASLIAASADSFTCGARLLLFELVGGDSNQYNPGQSANGGMGPESIVDTLLPLTSSKEVESDKADLVQGYSLNTLEKLSSALSIRGCQLKALQLSNINLGDTGLKILYRLVETGGEGESSSSSSSNNNNNKKNKSDDDYGGSVCKQSAGVSSVLPT